MSRPRSRSPHYRFSPRRQRSTAGHSRKFPWDEPDFDPHKVLAGLEGIPQHRSPHPREDFKEYRPSHRAAVCLADERRSSPFPDRQHHQDEELYHRMPSPHREEMSHTERRLSPRPDGGGEANRRRGGFRKLTPSFERVGRSPHSPLRERSLSAMGWRRDQRGRGGGRPRDLHPRLRREDLRGGAGSEAGRRDAQDSNRQRGTPPEERPHPFKRHRRELDQDTAFGFGTKEEPFSLEPPGGGFEGGTQGGISKGGHSRVAHSKRGLSHGDTRPSGPVGVGVDREHRRTWWEHFDLGTEFDGQSGPRQRGPSLERLRNPNGRSESREDVSERHLFKESWRDCGGDRRRSPVEPNRTKHMEFLKPNGPMNHRGRRGAHPPKGRLAQGERPGAGPPRSHPRFPQSPQRYQDTQDPPNDQARQGYRPPEEDLYQGPIEEEPDWEEQGRLQQWESDGPGSLEQRAARDDLEPKRPRQRRHSWTDQDRGDGAAAGEETLTIKVDMSRPVRQNSLLYYSSDRQLSLDLVSVGRQRLDFLPMLEHSGTYRESAVQSGTFAQEIITLVHHVKEQYFRGDALTLNQRFSASQQAAPPEEAGEEMTLDQRFSSNRGFSLSMNTLTDEELLFSRLGPVQPPGQQPVRGPGDLRHDLEKRRQERLEGVKVTIPGGSRSQRPLGSSNEPSEECEGEKDGTAQPEEGGFFTWCDERGRRRGGSQGARRGYRPHTGPQPRNNRIAKRLGPMRHQYDHAADAAW
ncbi:uncharacterized protein LOC143010910 [Genypterus blacodes]|uniref:uncharacterized protein LOC143010910 n=1 Tax=Genypterus blacodes TaxID=154954 RepID=UPI003F764CA0